MARLVVSRAQRTAVVCRAATVLLASQLITTLIISAVVVHGDANEPALAPTRSLRLNADDDGYNAFAGVTCAWRFVKYHPSAVESQWAANIEYNQDHVCDATKLLEEESKVWVHYSKSTFNNAMREALKNDTTPGSTAACAPATPPPQPRDHSVLYNVLSSFEYRWKCTGDGADDVPRPAVTTLHVPIEPLAGPLRHPGLCIASSSAVRKSFLLRRDYLVFDHWATNTVDAPRRVDAAGVVTATRRPKALYFDVGASTYLDGPGGPSQSYFIDWIDATCTTLRGVYAWEMKRVEPTKVFEDMPGVSRGGFILMGFAKTFRAHA